MPQIIDRPLVQYAVDEVRGVGIEQLVFVTGRGTTAIVEHFDTVCALEAAMCGREKSLAILEANRITLQAIACQRRNQCA